MTAALRNYQERMRRVLDYIDRHLDADLDLSLRCQCTKQRLPGLCISQHVCGLQDADRAASPPNFRWSDRPCSIVAPSL
jgi:hypothetical protein